MFKVSKIPNEKGNPKRDRLFDVLSSLLPEYSVLDVLKDKYVLEFNLYVLEKELSGEDYVVGGLIEYQVLNGYLAFIGVIEQKQGLGKKLIGTYARDLQKQGIEKITLDTAEDSDAERAFRRMGFEENYTDERRQVHMSANVARFLNEY